MRQTKYTFIYCKQKFTTASPKNCLKIKIGFIPVIPYSATDFDTIYTFSGCSFTKRPWVRHTMVWWRLLPLLNPDKFGKIFLGLWGFHFEKVIIAVVGKTSRKLASTIFLGSKKIWYIKKNCWYIKIVKTACTYSRVTNII